MRFYRFKIIINEVEVDITRRGDKFLKVLQELSFEYPYRNIRYVG